MNTNIKNRLDQYAKKHLLRKRLAVTQTNQHIITHNDNALINFSSNDYLGLSHNQILKQAAIAAIQEHGIGGTSSTLISGYTETHQKLENKFANIMGFERALLFNSGYHANIGIINTFANKNTSVYVDKLCHASIYDGISLTNTNYTRYKHNDISHLADKLKQQTCTEPFIISETVFSMQGNLADIPGLIKQTKMHNANLIIDDAHGFGVLGKYGKGMCEHFKIDPSELFCLVIPLGKAFGSLGAMVLGSNTCIEALIQFARSYRYTTTLPPSIVHANLAALDIITTETWRREQLWKLIEEFNAVALQLKLPLHSTDITPIRSIHIGDNAACTQIQQLLLNEGFLISSIRPPSVPINSACLRISLNTHHTNKQIKHLLSKLKKLMQTLN